MKEVEFLTKKEAASFLRISLREIDRLMERRELPFYKYGESRRSSVRFNKADLLKFVQRFRLEAQSA